MAADSKRRGRPQVIGDSDDGPHRVEFHEGEASAVICPKLGRLDAQRPRARTGRRGHRLPLSADRERRCVGPFSARLFDGDLSHVDRCRSVSAHRAARAVLLAAADDSREGYRSTVRPEADLVFATKSASSLYLRRLRPHEGWAAKADRVHLPVENDALFFEERIERFLGVTDRPVEESFLETYYWVLHFLLALTFAILALVISLILR